MVAPRGVHSLQALVVETKFSAGALAYRLLSSLAGRAPSSVPPTGSGGALEDLLLKIELSLGDPALNVQSLAEDSGLSRFGVHRLFKERLGLSPKQIVAMQGPFSQALNREMFRQYRADVIVTKNSGAIGGTDTKIAAAVELGLPVVVIDRPVLAYDRLVHCYEDVLSFVNNLED